MQNIANLSCLGRWRANRGTARSKRSEKSQVSRDSRVLTDSSTCAMISSKVPWRIRCDIVSPSSEGVVVDMTCHVRRENQERRATHGPSRKQISHLIAFQNEDTVYDSAPGEPKLSKRAQLLRENQVAPCFLPPDRTATPARDQPFVSNADDPFPCPGTDRDASEMDQVAPRPFAVGSFFFRRAS